VSHRAFFWTRVAVWSALYFLTGILGALLVAGLWSSGPDTAVSIALAAAVNLAQAWLVLLASVCMLSLLTHVKGTPRRLWLPMTLWYLLAFGLVWCSMVGLITGGGPESLQWPQALPGGVRTSISLIWALTHPGQALMPFQAAPQLEPLLGMWQIDADIWLFLALFAWCCYRLLSREVAGRAHSRYQSSLWTGRPSTPFLPKRVAT
jgi:hypothetical protein